MFSAENGTRTRLERDFVLKLFRIRSKPVPTMFRGVLMAKSISAFCKAHGLAKTTVHAWLKGQGYDTSKGLTPGAESAALNHFCPTVEAESVEVVISPIPSTAGYSMQAGGLVPRVSQPSSIAAQSFDAAAYQADKAALQHQAQQQAMGVNDVVRQYSRAKIAGVLADIDLAAETLRANALAEMGLTTGKHQAGGECPN